MRCLQAQSGSWPPKGSAAAQAQVCVCVCVESESGLNPNAPCGLFHGATELMRSLDARQQWPGLMACVNQPLHGVHDCSNALSGCHSRMTSCGDDTFGRLSLQSSAGWMLSTPTLLASNLTSAVLAASHESKTAKQTRRSIDRRAWSIGRCTVDGEESALSRQLQCGMSYDPCDIWKY